MNIFEKILTREEFTNDPPILIDIGASGTIHKDWKKIAKWSVCIAFDADDRDFNISENTNSGYKRLFTYNRIISDIDTDTRDFYLTQSPHCSSLLKPDNIGLEQWAFSPKFTIKRKVSLGSVTLPNVLKELDISRIDWFKTDSQGIDLRLFKSLDESIQNNMIITEFEPGILDAYEGEDKLDQVLSFMNQTKRYWLSRLTIKGTQRIRYDYLKRILGSDLLCDVSPYINKIAPGWGEMIFINNFEHEQFSKRELLLGWVFSSLQKEHGFAYQLASRGIARYPDEREFFRKLSKFSARKIKLGLVSLRYIPLLIQKFPKIMRRLLH